MSSTSHQRVLRRRWVTALALSLSVALVWVLATCAYAPRAGTPAPRVGDEIVVCGQFFHSATPVVLWTDPGGYDAYRVQPRFTSDPEHDKLGFEPRYGSRRHLPEAVRERVERDGWRLPDLQEIVKLFVIHYDVSGTSRQCFKVLQDIRGLSVHFLLDVDGTIYQTLDLKERACTPVPPMTPRSGSRSRTSAPTRRPTTAPCRAGTVSMATVPE